MRFVQEADLQSVPPHEDKFTTGVWQTEALPAIRDQGLRGLRFFYQPGAHSHWHTHTGEQAIIVLAGRGVVVRWGEEQGTAIGSGDWVHVEPGEKHWHGALPDDVFVQPPADGRNGMARYLILTTRPVCPQNELGYPRVSLTPSVAFCRRVSRQLVPCGYHVALSLVPSSQVSLGMGGPTTRSP
jgi:quercetin dioxygenase-like cupin family protein